MTDGLRPGALQGVRIVEFDAIGPVPMAATLLADMGADIVRIARRPQPGAAWDDVGGAVLHRSRPHVWLDLKSDMGRDEALRLAASADILLEGSRPGVMERLGLGPEPLLALNPRLVYGRMTGWGQTGPLALRAGHDINYIALSGALNAIGKEDAPPPVPLNLIGDYGGGAMFLIAGVLAALTSARATGAGQVVDVAMTDGTASLTMLYYAFLSNGGWRDDRHANLLDGAAPFYRCYTCADGGYVAVGALEPQFFAQLLEGLGMSGFNQHDRTGWPAMEAAFTKAFLSQPRDHWADMFADRDACVSPVLSFGEAPAHPHNMARKTYMVRDGIPQPSPAPRFDATPATIRPEREGEMTASDVLARWR